MVKKEHNFAHPEYALQNELTINPSSPKGGCTNPT